MVLVTRSRSMELPIIPMPNNQNNYPSSGRNSYLWGASSARKYEVYGNGAGYDASMRTTPSCASIEAALNYWFGMLTYTSCPGNAYHVWIINQYTIPPCQGLEEVQYLNLILGLTLRHMIVQTK